MKISTRINGRVTSINVRDSVGALHFLVCGDFERHTGKQGPLNHVRDACHDIISSWKGDTGKGLTSYITDKMLEDVVASEDIQAYHTIAARLSNG